ncbi:MAG: iron-containing alcohol dehydrogenase [Eubacterium sp.]
MKCLLAEWYGKLCIQKKQSTKAIYFGKGEEQIERKSLPIYTWKKVLVHLAASVRCESGLLDRVEKALEAEGIAYVELGGVTANPELKLVREGIALCQRRVYSRY